MPAAYWAALLFLAVGFAGIAYLPHPMKGDDDDDSYA